MSKTSKRYEEAGLNPPAHDAPVSPDLHTANPELQPDVVVAALAAEAAAAAARDVSRETSSRSTSSSSPKSTTSSSSAAIKTEA